MTRQQLHVILFLAALSVLFILWDKLVIEPKIRACQARGGVSIVGNFGERVCVKGLEE